MPPIRVLQHPDYQEELPAEWLVGVPDPRSAQEWEMLSFYRFVEIPHPEAFANMLQVWVKSRRRSLPRADLIPPDGC